MPVVHPTATPSHLRGRGGGVFPFHAGLRWSPTRVSTTGAVFDPTRIRPAVGAGPLSRALVPMALEMDGTDDVLSTTTLAGHSAGDALSMVFLVRPQDTGTLVSLTSSAGAGTDLVLLNNATSNFRYGIRKGGGTFVSHFSGLAMTAGELYVVAITEAADSDSRRMRIWHDGTLVVDDVDTTATATGEFSAGLSTLWVGDSVSSPSSWAEGSVAELGLWASELSTTETASLGSGESGLTVDKANLIDFFPFDAEREAAGVNGAVLTQTGSPTWNGTDPKMALIRDLSGNGKHGFCWRLGMTWEGTGTGRYLQGSGTATQKILISGVVVGSSPYSIHACTNTDTDGTNTFIAGIGDEGGSQAAALRVFTASRRGLYASDGTDTNSALTASSVGDWVVHSLRSSADDNAELWLNGALEATATNDVNLTTIDSASIGDTIAGLTNPYPGKIGRVVFTSYETDAQYKRIARWLGRPHGLAVA